MYCKRITKITHNLVSLIEIFKIKKKGLEMSRFSNFISHYFFFHIFLVRIFRKHGKNEYNHQYI